VNDKREGTGSAPDSVQQIIAAIETIDRKLTEHLAENSAPDGAATFEKARALLREAVGILTPAAPAEAHEETGPAKRRVKIKAESEVASSGESAKSPASRAKSTSRGGRASVGREPANIEKVANDEKVANGSLLARLGAAAEASPPPPEPTEPTVESALPPPKPESTVDATAQRLAQLEAEIADLTEAVTATPTRPAGPRPTARPTDPDQARAIAPAASETATAALADQDDKPDDDDEIAEITIIGADGAPAPPASRAARYAPRIFREGPSTSEEEAEVEIRGQDVTRSARRGSDGASSAHNSHSADKSGGRSKWRLFRGSR
jgi:hypothetical protein